MSGGDEMRRDGMGWDGMGWDGIMIASQGGWGRRKID